MQKMLRRMVSAASMVVILVGMSLPRALADSSLFPTGYCTRYAAQRFDATAPSPKCNWLGNAQNWLANADAAGWQTTTSLNSPYNGGVVVWLGGGFGHVAYLEYYNSSGIIVDEMNWGPTTRGNGIYGLGETIAQFQYRLANGITDKFGIVSRVYLSFTTVHNRSGYSFLGYIIPIRKWAPLGTESLYRLANDALAQHFYTVSSTERNTLINSGAWRDEGIACHVQTTNANGWVPFTRWRNTHDGAHVYTCDSNEIASLTNDSADWVREGDMGYVGPPASPQPSGTVDLFRFYAAAYNDHFYTKTVAEVGGVAGNGTYVGEGACAHVWP